MLLKMPARREMGVKALRETWKRNARGLDSRARYGFKLAKQCNATVYVHSIDTPILNMVNAFEGEPKRVPDTFWDTF